MGAAITVGSIIHLRNNAQGGGYLDTYGWVADKPAFWNVAGTERLFVSTHGAADRGGGTTSWRILSAAGKEEGAPLSIGDRVHLLNMYPDAGYLDSCGWIADLPPFGGYVGQVTTGVFTSGARDRDHGTGIWTIRSADQKNTGAPLLDGDAIALENGHPGTGSLVAYGTVTDHPLFQDFAGQQRFVFTSTFAQGTGEDGAWTVTLSGLDQRNTRLLFDYFSPDLLRGRTNNMEAVNTMTALLFADAFQAIGNLSIEAVAGLRRADQPQQALADLLGQATARPDQHGADVIDQEFQIKQLLNLFALSQALMAFDTNTLQPLMAASLQRHRQDKTISPLYLVRNCFREIATDHEIIQRATVQRRWKQLQGQATYYQSRQAVELLVMDKLAIKALRPFRHLLPHLAEQPVVITYFSDTTYIRHVPYTDRLILIGVSYDRTAPLHTAASGETVTGHDFAAFELMAIPHELGHYLYQHGRISAGADHTFADMSHRFRGNPYYRWCEEIFADLYGCVVAGPLSVFSIQAFLASGDTERAWRDDEEHPPPIVRAYILAEILRVLSSIDTQSPRRYMFTRVPDKLDEDWALILAGWGYDRIEPGRGRPSRVYLPDGAAGHLERIINVNRVVSTIRPIIEAFARCLLDALAAAPEATPAVIPWSASDEDASDTYAQAMATLTDRQAARAAIPLDVLFDLAIPEPATADAADADARLKAYLAGWDDHGPHGWGGH